MTNITKCSWFLLLSVSLSSAISSVVFSATTPVEVVYPKSWYFHLDAPLADKLQKAFGKDPRYNGMKTEEGLYFQDLRKASSQSEISSSSLLDALAIETSSSGGRANVGMFNRGFDLPEELWFLGDGNQKFQLSTYYPTKGKWTSQRLMQLPFHWFPVNGGVLSFNRDWLVARHPNNHKGNDIPVTALSADKTKRIQIRAYARTMQVPQPETPVYAFNSAAGKLLLVTIPEDGQASTVTHRVPNQLELSMVDIATGTAQVLPGKYDWPLTVNYKGVYYTEKDNDSTIVKFIGIDWFRGALDAQGPKPLYRFRGDDRMESFGSSFFILRRGLNGSDQKYTIGSNGALARYEGEDVKFSAITEHQTELMQNVDASSDLLSDLNLGVRVPLYANQELSQTLAQTLGRSQRTWTVVKYEEGQLPEEAVASFVWDLVTAGVSANKDLKEIQKVYEIPGSYFDLDDPKKIQDALSLTREVIDGTKTVLFVRDFPAVKNFEATKGTASTRLEMFWKTYESCIESGKCRVVMTMRDEVFKEMSTQLDGIFSDAEVVSMPKVSPEKRDEVAASVLAALQSKRNRILTGEAFKNFMRFSKSMAHQKASPGNELEHLQRLFDYLDTYHADVSEVDRTILQNWMDIVRGVDILKNNLDIVGLRKFLRDEVVSHDDVIDAVCNSLESVKHGSHFAEGPMAFYTFLGTTGTGKTFLAELIAEHLTGPKSLIKIDMSTFSGFGKDSPVFKELKASQDKIRVVLFDDVDQINGNLPLMDKLAAIVDEGIYGQGTEDMLSFRNTIVIWTSNWGETLIRNSVASGESMHNRLRRELTIGKDGNPPLIRPRIWGRIEGSLFVMQPFERAEWLELAIVMTRAYSKTLMSAKGINLRVDPRILLEVVAAEEEAQAGARSVKARLNTQVFNTFAQQTSQEGVTDIVVIQANGAYKVVTNLDGDIFNRALQVVPDILSWGDQDIKDYIKQFSAGQ